MDSRQFGVKPHQRKIDSPVLMTAETPHSDGLLTQITESREERWVCSLPPAPARLPSTLPKHLEAKRRAYKC